jgi:aldehyde:ferredoxin oxidoreductase
MGAVMGSKKLKAVAVKGNGPIPLADPLSFARLRSEANRSMRDDNVTRGLKELGTAAIADYLDYLGEMPKRGFTRGEMEGATNISGAMVAETILVGVKACHACVIACGREVRLDDGAKRKGPEYETLVGFGPNLWLDDAATATRLGELCDRYGMDVISVSGTIAFAILLFEEGYITEFDTDGITLKWGDPELIEQLVHMMAKSEGFGAFLAEGSRGLGKRFNRAERAVQVNGLEVPYHDPRGASGMGLVYATSPRGACHMQSDYFRVEIGKVESELGLEFFDRHGGSEKSANVAIHQNWTTLFNALVMCVFTNVAPQVVIDLINAATGLNWTIEDALIAGERAWNLKRVINNRLGLKRSNDKLPDPLLEPFPDGGSANFVIEFDEMLEVYYQARGWDWETGYPKREKLISLGLDWLVNDLYPEDG